MPFIKIEHVKRLYLHVGDRLIGKGVENLSDEVHTQQIPKTPYRYAMVVIDDKAVQSSEVDRHVGHK